MFRLVKIYAIARTSVCLVGIAVQRRNMNAECGSIWFDVSFYLHKDSRSSSSFDHKNPINHNHLSQLNICQTQKNYSKERSCTFEDPILDIACESALYWLKQLSSDPPQTEEKNGKISMVLRVGWEHLKIIASDSIYGSNHQVNIVYLIRKEKYTHFANTESLSMSIKSVNDNVHSAIKYGERERDREDRRAQQKFLH